MKRLYSIAAALCMLLTATTLYAQENEQNRPQQQRGPEASRGARQQEKTSGVPDLTVRAQDLNQRMTQELGNARWMRIIYREIDLQKEQNAPLYYPVRPMNGSMNLFSTIFQLMSEGKLTAYEYIPDYEIFDDNHIVDFKDVLDRSYIYYEEVAGRAGEASSYIVNESDIPSGDVLSYYVKEAWYFDQNNSVFDVKTLALCPIMSTTDDYGAPQTTALFWLPYENIRPYIANSLVMTSSVNNAKTFTIDDYFRRRMFEGEIIKTENLMNKTLREFYPEPDSLKLAQEQIEGQLVTFEKSLWMQPDTTQAEDKEAVATAKKSVKTSSSSSRGAKTPSTKQPKAPKSGNSSAAPVRSVRRTR